MAKSNVFGRFMQELREEVEDLSPATRYLAFAQEPNVMTRKVSRKLCHRLGCEGEVWSDALPYCREHTTREDLEAAKAKADEQLRDAEQRVSEADEWLELIWDAIERMDDEEAE